MRRAPRWSVVPLALVALASLPHAARAQAPLPPATERAMRRLVSGGPLADGTTIDDVRLERTRLEIDAHGPSDRTTLVLLRRGRHTTGLALGDTASFSTYVGSGSPTMARAVLARVTARDVGHFFETTAQPTEGVGARRLGVLDDVRRALTWGALVLVLLWLTFQRRVAPVEWRWALLVALGAAAVRVAVPPWAPLHANMHGLAELRGLVGAHGGLAPSESDRYGVAYRQVVQVALAGMSRSPTDVFALGVVASAAACVAAWALVRRVTGRGDAALLAALCVAVHPVLVTVAPTEAPSALAITLLLASLALGAHAVVPDDVVRSGDVRVVPARVRTVAAWGCGLALACGCELHVQTLLFVFVVALVVAAVVPPGERRGALRRLALPASVAVLTATLHALALTPLRAEVARRPFAGVASLFAQAASSRGVWLDASQTSPLVLVLAGVGVVCLLAHRKTRAAAVALGIAVVVLATASLVVDACRSDAVRYQSVPASLFDVLAGCAAAAIPRAWRRRSWVLVALAALVVATSWPGLADARRGSLDAAAYRYVATHDPWTDVIVVPEMDGDARRIVLADVPDVALGSRPAVVREGEPRRGTRCVVWIGPACWSFPRSQSGAVDARRAPHIAGGPMRGECVDALGGLPRAARIAPTLRAMDVPHRDEEFHLVVAATPRIGWAACPW